MLLSPGIRLGPYEILSAIGAGGMGEVYRARDTRLGREVAVKILPEQFSKDANAVARFQSEARLLASLNHANIVAIHDVGTDGGVSYLVSELVEGQTLRRRLADGALSADLALDYARQMVEGMAAAHDRGIVHRDLKPENILIASAGRVKILDFGLARVQPAGPVDAEGETLAGLTRPGIALGTVGYIAPELLRGQPVDHRSDLFAFGAILHEMITGLRAFPGRTSAEVLASTLTLDVEVPPGIGGGVSGSLETIAVRCLKKNPVERFQTARELLDALVAVGSNISTGQARGPAAGHEGSDAQPSLVVLPFADMSPDRDQEYFCDGMAEEIVSALAQAPGLHVIARSSAFQFKGAARDVRDIGRTLGATTVLEGSIRKASNTVRIAVRLVNAEDGRQMWAERYDRDLRDALAVQDEIARHVADALAVRLVGASSRVAAGPIQDLEAYTLYLKGRHHWNRRTETDLEQSISYFRQAIEHQPSYARAYAGLADALTILAVYSARSPGSVLPEARSAARRALELDPKLTTVQTCLGTIESLFDWMWTAADQTFRQAIALNPDDAGPHQARAANYLMPLGRFDEALAELRLAMALDPLSPVVSTTIGIVLFYARRYEDAAAALAEALRIDDRFGLAHFFASQTYAAQQRFQDAERAIEAAIHFGGRTPQYLSGLGDVLARSGRADSAREIVAELEKLSACRYVSSTAFARVHAALGDRERALDELERALHERSLDLAWVKWRPSFDVLQDHPRFRSVFAAMGLA